MFHRLLAVGWWYLYARKSGESADVLLRDLDSEDFFQAVDSDASAAPVCGDGMSVDDFFSFADESRDILQRRERVRAKKAGSWIRSRRFIPNLVQVVAGTGPRESYLHCQLAEHAESTWTGQYGIPNLSLVQLVQNEKSPAVAALDRYWFLQTSGVEMALEALVGVPGIDLRQEMQSFFQLLVDMSSVTWRKLV